MVFSKTNFISWIWRLKSHGKYRMFYLNSCIEFYIINECNLTCSDCNRFNNYDFRGYYRWKDNADAVAAWSKRINAPLITLIGGEPALHPELDQWVKGVCEAWPKTQVMIQTNGTIPKIQELSDRFSNLGFGIAIHSQKMSSKLSRDWSPTVIFDATKFNDCALIDQGPNFRVHKSDPAQAFDACSMRHSHTILNGRLYKCPLPAVLPEFRKQYEVELDQEQHDLLYGYKSLNYDCSNRELIDFIDSRNDPIPQCSLCPSKFTSTIISFDPNRKKRPRIS